MVFKPTLEKPNLNPILKRHCGRKEFTMIYAEKSNAASAENTIVNTDTSLEKQNQFSLTDKEVIQLSQWCYKIEKHYEKAMDIEWAKDGLITNFILFRHVRKPFMEKKINSIGKFINSKKKVLFDQRNCAW